MNINYTVLLIVIAIYFAAMVVIDDGQWRDRSLALCGKDRCWGENVLKKEHLTVRQVFLMTADAAGHTHIVRKER